MYKHGNSRWLKKHLQKEVEIFVRVLSATALIILVLTCAKIEHKLQNYLFGGDSSCSACVQPHGGAKPYIKPKRHR